MPVALHLDQGNSFELCAQALRAGYTSVMIDGSTLPLVQNICLLYTSILMEQLSPSLYRSLRARIPACVGIDTRTPDIDIVGYDHFDAGMHLSLIHI